MSITLFFRNFLKAGILEDVTNEPSAFPCHYPPHRRSVPIVLTYHYDFVFEELD